MPNHAIVATVTPNPNASNGTGFDWVYSVDGKSQSGPATPVHVKNKEQSEIVISLVAGGASGDTCIFQGEPLAFTDEEGTRLTSSPSWFSGLQDFGPSCFCFMDDNNSGEPDNETYHILINMVYTSGGESDPQTSPDPTIVNEGTNVPAVQTVSHPVPQAEPQPVAAGG